VTEQISVCLFKLHCSLAPNQQTGAQKQRIDDLDLKIALSERASANHDQSDKSLPPLLVFPVHSNHPIVQDWPAWKHEVHTALDTCGIHWVSMGVLIKRRSMADTGRQPTITVTVSETQENVEKAKRMIEDICERNGHPLLNVEIRRGRIWR
jgi:hypothetical protein